jgi:CheY-like chemotaxis protein
VVDDYFDTAAVMCMLLDAMGHESRGASTGADALRVFTEWKPQVAIVDLEMPDLDGFHLSRLLRERCAGQHLVIVALTGSNHPAAGVIAAGFDHYVRKPTVTAQLTEVLINAEQGLITDTSWSALDRESTKLPAERVARAGRRRRTK